MINKAFKERKLRTPKFWVKIFMGYFKEGKPVETAVKTVFNETQFCVLISAGWMVDHFASMDEAISFCKEINLKLN